MNEAFAATASLLAEPSRAVMLLKLLGGKAMPAGELALAANVSPQTASGHLAKLVEAQMVQVTQQGRHRYYRLAGADVAHALEAMLSLLPESRDGRAAVQPTVGTIAHARTCYSHLAGWLGVRIADALQHNGWLNAAGQRAFVVTDAGQAWFEQLGIPVDRPAGVPDARYARQCLDWTERRPHLAGTLGVRLYRRLVELEWLAVLPDTRAVRITSRGRTALWQQLGVAPGR